MARYTYECEKGHVTEVYKGINDPKPWNCIQLVPACEGSVSKQCGAPLEWVPEPVSFTIK